MHSRITRKLFLIIILLWFGGCSVQPISSMHDFQSETTYKFCRVNQERYLIREELDKVLRLQETEREIKFLNDIVTKLEILQKSVLSIGSKLSYVEVSNQKNSHRFDIVEERVSRFEADLEKLNMDLKKNDDVNYGAFFCSLCESGYKDVDSVIEILGEIKNKISDIERRVSLDVNGLVDEWNTGNKNDG